MKGYLLTYADYEGREILSLHTEEEILSAYHEIVAATKRVNELYSKCKADRHSTNYEKFEKLLDQESIPEKHRYLHFHDVERYCIMEVDENGADCVCGKFGVGPKKTVWSE